MKTYQSHVTVDISEVNQTQLGSFVNQTYYLNYSRDFVVDWKLSHMESCWRPAALEQWPGTIHVLAFPVESAIHLQSDILSRRHIWNLHFFLYSFKWFINLICISCSYQVWDEKGPTWLESPEKGRKFFWLPALCMIKWVGKFIIWKKKKKKKIWIIRCHFAPILQRNKTVSGDYLGHTTIFACLIPVLVPLLAVPYETTIFRST
jgi:hypothetical protein